jgi:hypothetical protein
MLCVSVFAEYRRGDDSVWSSIVEQRKRVKCPSWLEVVFLCGWGLFILVRHG